MRTRLAVAALAAAGSLGACSSPTPASAPAAAPSTAATAGPATSATSAAPASTAPRITVYVPTDPQTSPDAAAYALVRDWSTGDRSGAGGVGSPQAVGALFAIPYPAAYIQSRGCTDPSIVPGTCTYANRDSGSLYEMSVTRMGSGWYVSAVTVEN